MQLPRIDARTLQGVDKRLPRDLPAQRTLVLLPFRRWQQHEVDAWVARAGDAGWTGDLSEPTDGLICGVIEIPCLTRRWGPARRFIDGGMASSIGIPAVLARTWTTYTDVGGVQRALGVADSAHTWVGVVSREGDVLAGVSGTPDGASWPLIAGAMAGLRR